MEQKIDFSENRNIFMPNIQMKKSLLRAVKKVFEYPDYKNTAVNGAIANYFDIPCDNVSITNGSMESINLLVKVLEGKNATLFKPTFWGYEDALERYEYNVKSVPLDCELKYNINSINMQAQKTDIMFICNPNNPTLDNIDKNILIKIINNNPNCHFIVDETMLIFDKNFFNKSLVKYVNTADNLSVIVSFSKFLGIAGLRTGAVFSNNELIKKIKKQMVPYSFGIIQQELLPCAFSDKEYLDETRELIKINREQLCEMLKEIGCHVIDGDSNFILVQLPFGIDSNVVTKFLLEYNIIVRNIKDSYPELTGDWLRISINTKNNNEMLVKKLKQSFSRFSNL